MQKTDSMRNEKGQAMTEFAVVLPVVALVLFAILQFGIAFNNYLTLTDAVRARRARRRRLAPDRERVERHGRRREERRVRPQPVEARRQRQLRLGGRATTSSSRPPTRIPSASSAWSSKSGNLKSTTTERVE